MPDDKLKKLVRQSNIVRDEQDRLYDAGRYAGEQRTISELGLQPLGKYDVGLSPYTPPEGQEAIRAQTMTGWQARGNALAQVIGEVGFGTLEGAGYLLDFAQYKNVLLDGDEREFSNWFSDIMRSGKDWVGENFPIYGGEGFQPLSGRWWSRNAPSIASTLSLVVPAAGGVKALSSLAKFAKGKKLLETLAKISSNTDEAAAAFAKQMSSGVKGLSGALLSRYMENTLEAAEVMESTIAELISQGMSEEEARIKAGDAAANTWYANNVALLTDIPQYLMLFKAPSILKAASADRSKIKDVLATMASEGAEEAYQYGVQEAAGDVSASGSGVAKTLRVIERMLQEAPEYRKDPEFWNAVALGALGGGIFATAGAFANDKINRVNQAYAETRELLAQGKDIAANQRASEELVEAAAEDPEAVKGMIELADGVEDQERVDAAKNTLADVEKQKEIRKGQILGDEKAKDAAKAKAADTNAKIAKQEVDQSTASLLEPQIDPEAKVRNDVLKIQKKKYDELRKKHKKDPEAIKVIDKLEAAAEKEFKTKGNLDLSSNPSRAEIENKIDQQVDLEFKAAYLAKQVNKTGTPKGDQEYLEAKVKEGEQEIEDRVNTVLEEEDPTPQQLASMADGIPQYPDLQQKLRDKFKEKYDAEMESVLPPGEDIDSVDAWLDSVYAANPFIAHMRRSSRPKLMQIWNDAKKQDASTVSVGDRFRSESKILEIVDIKGNNVTIRTYEETEEGGLVEGLEYPYTMESLVESLEEGTWVPFESLDDPTSAPPESQKGRNDVILTDSPTAKEELFQEEPGEFDVLPDPEKSKRDAFLPMSNDIKGKYEIVDGERTFVFQIDNKGYLEEDPFLANQLGDNLATPEETRRFRRKFAQLVDPSTVEVRFAIDKSTPFNQREDTDANNILVHAVVRYGDKWYSIGVLQAVTDKRLSELSKAAMDNIKAIRAEMWNNMQSSEESLILSDGSTRINAVYKGHLLNLPISRTLQEIKIAAEANPDESMLPNGQVYLAIGTGDGDIFIGDLPEGVSLNTAPIQNPKKGRVYFLVKSPNGRYYWARLYTVPVEERLELKEEILKELSIAEEAHRELQSFEQSLGGVTAIQKQKRVSEELKKGDEGNLPNLARWNREWKDVKDAVQSIVRWRREKRNGDFELEPDFNQNLFSVKKFWENGTFSAQKFYDSLLIDKRPVQIDAARINDPEYNDSILDRLKTDLDSSTAFHSPKFELEFYKPESSEESVPSEIPKEKVSIPASKKRGDFKAREVTVTSYPKMDVEKAVAWLKKRLPGGVSIQVVNGIIHIGNMNAWGVTRNAAIQLSSIAAKGTEYHEAFHVVFNNLLSENERNRILSEARKKYGSDLETERLEEELAEEFRRYIQESSSITGRIKRFFRRLLEFIGLAKSHNGQIEYLFRQIESGEFRDRPIISRQFEPKLRSVGKLSAAEVREATSVGLNLLELMMDAHGYEQMDYTKALSTDIDRNLILSTDLDRFPQGTVITDFIAQYEEHKDDPNFNTSAIIEIVTGLRPDIIFEDGAFKLSGEVPRVGKLYYECLKGLANRGWNVKLNTGQVVGISNVEHSLENIEEYDESQEHREWWAISEISISPKEQLSARLKRWLSNIKVPNEQDSLGLGYDKFYSGNEVYPLLQREIGNCYSFEDMIHRINRSTLPLMEQIKAQLEGYDSNQEKMNLATDLYKHVGQQQHPAYKVVSVDRRKDSKGNEITSWRLFDSNTFTLSKAIMSDFSDGFKKENADRALVRVKEFFDPKKNPDVVDKKLIPVDRFVKAMEFLGFKMPDMVAKSMTERDAFYAMSALRSGLQSKKDFDVAFKKLVNQVKKYYPQDYQDTHFNVVGEKVYEWINSNFFGRILNKANASWEEFVAHYKRDPLYNHLPILDRKKEFEFAIVDGIKYRGQRTGTNYNSFSDRDMLLTQMAHFYNNGSKSTAYISLPILSDSPTLAFVSVPKHNNLTKGGGVYEDLTRLIRFEWDRMRRTEETPVNYSRDKVWLFKEFKEELESDVFDPAAVRSKVEDVMTRYEAGLFSRMIDLELAVLENSQYKASEDVDSGIGDLPTFIRFFAAHHLLYHSQLMLLSTGDPAFYKSKNAEINLGDFYKRAKEIWSPGTYLNKYNFYIDRRGNLHKPGQYSNNGKMRIRVLPNSTQRKKSDHYDTIAGIIGEDKADPYKNVEVADGQTYIDLVSWREREIGLNQWDDLKQAAFDFLVRGRSVREADVKKFNRETREAIEKAKTKEAKARLKRALIPQRTSDQPYKPYVFTHRIVNNILTPTQKKDSEFIMLPIYGVEGYELYNPEFRSYLEDMGYDFEQMNYKNNLIENRKYDVVTFESTIKVGNFSSFDENSIIEIGYEDWRKQQEVPEHHKDTSDKFGIQTMKLITADLEKGEYTLPDGTALTKEELIEEYHNLIIADVKASYVELEDRLTGETPKETFDNLVAILREEVLNRGMGDQYMEALEQSPNEFLETIQDTNLPLWHPLHANRIESLLNAIFRKNVTNQKFASGASLVNTSAWGFNKKPQLKFSSNGKRLLSVEACVPIYNSELERYVNPETGMIGEAEMNKIREDIEEGKIPDYLRALTYRIPTEDKYSMFNIEIIGFLPSDSGAIILPEEVTTIAGLDFDIDKLHAFFYGVNPYAKELQRWEKYIEDNYDKKLDTLSKPEWEEMLTFFDSQAEVEPDHNVDIIREVLSDKGMSYEAYLSLKKKAERAERKIKSDNRKLDLMRAIMQSEVGTRISLTPGGFERIKANNERIRKIQKPKPVVDFLDPLTQVDIANRMNAGKALIGFAANYNSCHALWMNHGTELLIKGPFRFNDQHYGDLSEHRDSDGVRVTNNLSEVLAAVVDNGKDPQASYFNFNTFTADLALTMLTTGVPLKTVQLFLTQNSIRRVTAEYFNKGASRQIEKQIYNKYEEVFGNLGSGASTWMLTEEDLEKGLKGDDNIQQAALHNFLIYKKRASHVADFVRATRQADAGAGPTQPDNLAKINAWEEDFSEKIPAARSFLESTTFTNALYNEGVVKSNQFIVENGGFPNLNTLKVKQIFNVIKQRQGYQPTAKEINIFYRDLMDYIASNFEFFKNAEETISRVPKQLLEFQAKYPNNKLLNRLTVVDGVVQFKAVTGMDYSEEQEIREDWEDLLYSDDEDTRFFGEELIRYTFARNGFKFGFNTFSHLQPVSFYAQLKDSSGQYFNDYMAKNLKIVENGSAMNEFFTQYVDNNYENLRHVPSVIWGVEGQENNVVHVEFKPGKIPYFIYTGMKDAFMYRTDLGFETPHPYIKIKAGNRSYLFKHSPDINGAYRRIATKSARDSNGKKLYQSYEFGRGTVGIADAGLFGKYVKEHMSDLEIKREVPSKEPDVNSDNPVNDECNS